jgi:hypothetical protein
MILDLRRTDLIGVIGTSYSKGNSGLFPPMNPKWFTDLRNRLRTLYAPNGLANTGAKVNGITTYQQYPLWIDGGEDNATMNGFGGTPNMSTNFLAFVGQYNPTVLILEAGVNDYANPSFAADAATLAAAVINPANYPVGGKLPRWIIWLSPIWRGSEQWTTPGPDPNIASHNTLVKAQCVTSGFPYIDIVTPWLAAAPTNNPLNATAGYYAPDGTHPSGPLAPHGDLGGKLMSDTVFSALTIQL